MNISDFALGNRPAVYALVLVVVILGFSSYTSLPRESSPDIEIPYVVVTTMYFGTTPQDMETLVTNKLEKELGDIIEIKEMRSSSAEGISNITLEFNVDEDINDMLPKIREKIDLAKPELPEDAEDPIITELSFEAFPILLINISGEYDLVKLKDIAEDLQARLEQIPGVLEVNLSGGLEREVQVNVNPDKLRHYRLGLMDVEMAIRNENINIPGGSVDIGRYSYLLRIPGEIKDPDEIGDFVVKADGHHPIYIRDVAEIVYGFKDVTSTARMAGNDCITIGITKRAGENLIGIADEARSIVAELLPQLPATTHVSFSGDQSKDIKMMVADLENGILSGLFLVIAVLIFILGFRTSLFVAISIPLSMLISFLVIELLGYTLNMIVLFSLILALGMLVDNAIVIVENIYRFMSQGEKPHVAAAKGVKQVSWAVIASTATTLSAFAPMIFWPDIIGEFMKYLPITLIITLSSSLFVALVINPVFCATYLKPKMEKKGAKPYEERWLVKLYIQTLNFALNRRVLVMIVAVLTLIGATSIYGIFGTGIEFFPDIDPPKIFANFELPSGSRLEATDKMLKRLEKSLPKWPNVRTFVAQAGVSLSDFDFSPGSGPVNQGRISIDMVDRPERVRSTFKTMADIRESLKDYAGATISVEKMEEGPPTGKPVNIEIVGEDFETLGKIAQDMMEVVKTIPGVVNLQTDYDGAKPEVQVRIDRNKAAYLGVNTAMVGSSIRTAINGTEVGYYREGSDEYDITLRLDKQARSSMQDIEDLQFTADEGKLVPLSSFADVFIGAGLGSIRHKDEDRSVTVFSDTEGRLSNDVLNDVKAALKDYSLPLGYTVKYTGENEEQDKAAAFLSKAFMIAVFSIGLILLLQFRSFLIPLIIISSVILSLVGVFVGLTLTRMPFGIIMTGVGIISLAGVVVNNAIVLLDYTLQLRKRGMEKRESIVRAGVVRLRPVLLTAATTILGLLPMATGLTFDFRKFEWIFGSDSTQWWGSMAVAVIFGLMFATMLTLVIVPVMYSLSDSLSVRMNNFWRRVGIANMEEQ